MGLEEYDLKKIGAFVMVVLAIAMLAWYFLFFAKKPAQPAAVLVDCTKFQKEEERNLCYYNEAIRLTDIKKCEGIAVPLFKESCVMNIASKTGNIDACKRLSESTKTSCVINTAREASNPGFCTELQGKAKEECILFAEKKPTAKTCASINTVELKELCISAVAISGKTPELCEGIADKNAFDSCVLGSTRVFYVNSCNMLKISENRDSCLKTIAIQNNDANTCKLIDSTFTKNSCLASVK